MQQSEKRQFAKVQSQLLIVDNLKLVYHVANKFMPCPKGYYYEVDDLVSEGYIGLVVAAKNYDPAKGSFSTYACKVIESKIKRSLPKYELSCAISWTVQYQKNPKKIHLQLQI
ncbi:sigma-70 family RNA polymerase sigma factor [Caldicellulosiruptor bescii]|uniref:sigma-70 family RNA polymerase sigma factor n=1 Tax=Caldicellulosiruptor bescii TaxID=31899 RepID=UPI00211B079C|nr:sigma-70 family RNA polymerase sigma factor [Caldicellulosiruptor bescii]